MAAGAPAAEARQALGELLGAAAKGEEGVRWLTEMLERVGFVRVRGGRDAAPVLVTISRLTGILGKSRRSVDGLIGEGLPVYRPGVGNRPALYDVAAVVRWYLDREREQEALVTGPGSVWLEELRRQKALAAKRENEIADGLWVARDDMAEDLQRVTVVLRNRFDAVGRTYGAGVAAAIQGALDEAEKEWLGSLPAARGAGADGDDAADDDDASGAGGDSAGEPAVKRGRVRRGKGGGPVAPGTPPRGGAGVGPAAEAGGSGAPRQRAEGG